MKRIHYLATNEDEGRLLRDVIPSRMAVSKRLMKRCKAHPEGILVNGVRRTVRYVVHAGDDISLAMSPAIEGSDIIHENRPLTIVYEDDMLLVVDKPPGITMFPRHRGERGSLAGAVLAHLEACADCQEQLCGRKTGTPARRKMLSMSCFRSSRTALASAGLHL